MKATKVFAGKHYEGYVMPNGEGYTGLFLHLDSGRKGFVVEFDPRATRVEKMVRGVLKTLEAYHETMCEMESPAAAY